MPDVQRPHSMPWKWLFFALLAGNLIGCAWSAWETWA
jgi:hypothetical protein